MDSTTQIPTATYRLQLNRTFTFRDAAALVPYLNDLGISHCYMSPYLRARPGSLHGYDIIDHKTLNPELGTAEDYDHFIAELKRHGIGQIIDIVPNHMGVMGSDNAWWLDVLENGEASDYADFFDIDWDPIKDELQGKVLIPILADQYGNVLESGELALTFDSGRGEFSISYHEHRFPIDPAEYPRVLSFAIDRLKEQLGGDNEAFLELQSISTAFGHLPSRRGVSEEQRAERAREKEVQKRRLAALCERSSDATKFVTENVQRLNGRPGDPSSYEDLHELIKAQVFRLAQWRVAADDINYRRFFDINDLAALRMENAAVFEQTHRFILELVAQGKVQGLRIDHPDGLYDPLQYFGQLREEIAGALGTAGGRVYTVAEKILTGKERLRANWPVDGTTGYDFANLVNGLFVNQDNCMKMDRIYRSFSGNRNTFDDLEYGCRKLILKVGLGSELNVLANLLGRIALANRHTCDFTLNSLRNALSEVIASFPVYRTYVRGTTVSADDRRYVEEAVSQARRRSNADDLSVFDFIRKMLLVGINNESTQTYKHSVIRFAMKFQQVTAAVMAKGVEDTAFYRYNRLTSLNEVGGNPAKFGTSIDEFHRANQQRAESWPDSMLSTSTHDSKRSEDARARINVLSEIPAEWRLRLRRWRDWNKDKKRASDGHPAPTADHEYLIYQTLLGAFPDGELDGTEWERFIERIQQYLLKAAREAKRNTSWANPNQAYEDALTRFIAAMLDRADENQFLVDFRGFQKRVSRIGTFNSLSQTLLKLTSPGVPDFYQGTELFDFSLVDPDNRRPVDYELRRRSLNNFKSVNQRSSGHLLPWIDDLAAHPEKVEIKQYLIWKSLLLRKQHPLLFREGKYAALPVSGEKAAHIVAFTRRHRQRQMIVVVPRLYAGLLNDRYSTVSDPAIWGNTRVEVGKTEASCYHNLFTGNCISAREPLHLPVADLFHHFPVALLMSGD